MIKISKSCHALEVSTNIASESFESLRTDTMDHAKGNQIQLVSTARMVEKTGKDFLDQQRAIARLNSRTLEQQNEANKQLCSNQIELKKLRKTIEALTNEHGKLRAVVNKNYNQLHFGHAQNHERSHQVTTTSDSQLSLHTAHSSASNAHTKF
ncbi:unnamed protein product [Caenorhabditis auriculariae]|uniref:Uncharacterized protein n=1 Tax=Caenorhabditis auriculariae TaxID=2777116 RepID=A0A8S1HS38_9PELO|nr:unnamed protein product [Caenorhabditis auriculariae]